MKLLLLSGSFHSGSRSLRIARFLRGQLAGHQVEIPALQQLPFYCEDLNRDQPASVRAFLQAVRDCDAILCITPEYNHSIPAVLKNAIDWASRPAFHSPLKDKPVSLITQADSPVGGARAQAHLKLVLDSTLCIVFPAHEMMITGVSRVLAAGDDISDPDTRRRTLHHVEAFIAFAQRVGR